MRLPQDPEPAGPWGWREQGQPLLCPKRCGGSAGAAPLCSHANSVLECCLLFILAGICTEWENLDMDRCDQDR